MRSSGRACRWLARAAALFVLISLPADAAAQRGRAGQDTTLTREELIRQRLRTLGPLIQDTTAQDSLAADSLAQDTLPAPPAAGPMPRGTLPGVERDSLMRLLLELPGYTPTEYKGDSASFAADSGRLELRRNAAVLEDGQVLTADSTITYWEQRSIACATGNPNIVGAGTSEPISGDSLCYNTRTRLGTVTNARTTVSEGAEWHVQGDFFVLDRRYYGHDAIFTDCDLEEPHYHFAAKSMKVLPGNVIVARNVTMKFGDVPVFWLPFFVQSLGRGRQSGILFPGFQVNDIVRTNTGYQRRITDLGFYWAINDYMGARVAVDWYSNNWTALNGSFDYRVLDKFLNGGATVRRFWREDGGREFTLATQNSWEMNERTRLSLSANYATSSQFVRQNTFDPREVNQMISSNAGLNRRFDWGNVNLTASRQQYLSDGRVTMTLPQLSVSFPTKTLFEALPGEESWYSNATWTGDLSAGRKTNDPGERLSIRSRPGSEVTSRVSSSFTLGDFSWSQRADLTETRQDPFGIDSDTLVVDNLGARARRAMTWSTSLDYQQRLIGTSTFTPSLTLRGELIEGDTTGGQRIAAPTRIDFGANLRTDVYGFWPGIGPVERIRHKITPGISYTYSPEPNVTDRQREFFRVGDIREQNRISLNLTQTIEAKIRQREDTTGVAADSVEVEVEDEPARPGEPRRIPRNEPIQVLSLSTSAVAYDFVQAREEGDGFVTAQITNNITSDLLRGLQLSVTHDLFEETRAEGPDGQSRTDRRFAPTLSQLNASFSLNSDSWIARMLGLGRREPDREEERQAADTLAGDTLGADTLAALETGPAAQTRGEQFGLIGSGRRDMMAMRGAVGTWNASFNYSLTRPREGEGGLENQQLMATVSFQPTENWSVNWNTGYSFTTGEFTDHILTLTRTLHDWDANFDFVKTQNGNLSFQFRVALRANADIKLDYEQRERATFPAPRPPSQR